VVDVFRPSATHGQRTDDGLQFLQRGVVESFDGQVEVLMKDVEPSDPLGEGYQQPQGSGGQHILEGISPATDLDRWRGWESRLSRDDLASGLGES
jgi:hypothetical protein